MKTQTMRVSSKKESSDVDSDERERILSAMQEQGFQLSEDGSKWEKIENGEATKTIDLPNEKLLNDFNTFSFILITLSFLSIIIAPNAEGMFFCYASPILLIIAFTFMLVGNEGQNGYTIVFFIVVGMMYWVVVYLVLGDILSGDMYGGGSLGGLSEWGGP
tara:strand:+ start:147 stop:629 length:483 start_codon:yes stop_codon:yes gene_type:complete